jgi:hypothetical protein
MAKFFIYKIDNKICPFLLKFVLRVIVKLYKKGVLKYSKILFETLFIIYNMNYSDHWRKMIFAK